MGKNTSISLGTHFEEFIEKSIETGRFNNASEVVRAGLRLLEDEEYKVANLRNALIEGTDSGRAEGFDASRHLESLKNKRANHGELHINK
ncbi:MAG: type II toxin-antitoxin system ParD family antitoxin [Bacteroidota bacterium]